MKLKEKMKNCLSNYAKSVVYGGLDGTMTTFAIVASVHAISLHPVLAVVLGLANLVADAFSMGMADYLSDLADNEQKKDKLKERMQFITENKDNQETMTEELKKRYARHDEIKNISDGEVDSIAYIMKRYPKLLALHMIDMESEDDSRGKAALSGLVTFISFIVFGIFPLLTYLVPAKGIDTFISSISVTLGILFTLGILKGLICHSKLLKSSFEVLITGVFVGGISYLLGSYL